MWLGQEAAGLFIAGVILSSSGLNLGGARDLSINKPLISLGSARQEAP